MPITKRAALKQIDAAIAKYDDYEAWLENEGYTSKDQAARYAPINEAAIQTCLKTTIERLAPPGSFYQNTKNDSETLVGVLRTLRDDIKAGHLVSYRAMLHGETFSDFLDMASHLLGEGYFIAAAVIAGGVLEQHLRALCTKYRITPVPDKLNNLNTALYNKAYQSDWQKQITAWADIRNKAAHGDYTKVKPPEAKQRIGKQVELMIQAIRLFISSHPA